MRTLLAVLALAGASPMASSPQIDMRPFTNQVKRIAGPTGVPIILPAALFVEGVPRTLYSAAQADHTGWQLEISTARYCAHANACSVAWFAAKHGDRLPGKPNATLAGGLPALYRPVSCGGSCAPANLWFVRKSVLYSWQVKDPPRNARAALLQMAAQALRAGPR